MKKLFAAAVLLLLHPLPGMARREPPLSRRDSLRRDSLRLERFEDSAFHSNGLFSQQRQHWLDSALRIAPHRAYYWQQKAMPLFKQHKYEAGMPYLDSAVKYGPEEYIDYRAFMKCIFQKSYHSALEDFYAAKAINGNAGVMDHPYDFYIALCHLQLNNFDSAKHYLNRCIARRRPKGGDDAVHYLHWYYMGIANYVTGSPDSAIACLNRSLRQYSNFSDAKYYKALALEQKGDMAEALRLMREAKQDLAAGYTINEDNAFYETYPYQLNKYYLDGAIKYLQSAQPASRIYRLPSGDTLKQFYFVMLRKGPKRSAMTDTAAINRIQQGHMDNIARLHKLGKLKVAGPFGDEGDWRGIFVFDCATQAEVEALLATDPAIAAGRLAYEIHPWWTQVGTVFR